MHDHTNTPRVGLGVIIVNHEGKILVGKRKNRHAPYFSIPGGHLDLGESFEQAAIREVKEETNIDIFHPQVISVSNNLETYQKEGLHYISIALLAKKFSGTPEIMEPEKCERWSWEDPNDLPMPHFDVSQIAVDCYLKKIFYE